MATINYHLESTWLPHGYHMVTVWLSLGYYIEHMYARSSGKNICYSPTYFYLRTYHNSSGSSISLIFVSLCAGVTALIPW